jgi:hypothetical protein
LQLGYRSRAHMISFASVLCRLFDSGLFGLEMASQPV